ncbi:MAG: hypothetical protein RJA36_2140 [Pseudomonadota bacterium]|jgi:choline dehydrogenase-like flavoprotein
MITRATPGQYYFVGGHTKFCGTAMFRFRARDFEDTVHADGISPAWPFSYDELEPWHARAEALFGVHGLAGEDPTEPWRSTPYPHGPVPHEPVVDRLAQRLRALGLKPFHMPTAIDLHQGGSCTRCGQCDAFACQLGAKGDAETRLLAPILNRPNVELWSDSRVTRLVTDDAGRSVVGAEVEVRGQTVRVQAPLFVLGAGAINSALLLQRSANSRHPAGLANSSGCVGRYYMNHNTTGLMALMPWTANDTRLQKTLSLNDFYWGCGAAGRRPNRWAISRCWARSRSPWSGPAIRRVRHGPGAGSRPRGAGSLVPVLRPSQPLCRRRQLLAVVRGAQSRPDHSCRGAACRSADRAGLAAGLTGRHGPAMTQSPTQYNRRNRA